MLAKGATVGSYRLVDDLGHGGVRRVWKAEHVVLLTPAVVKEPLADAALQPKVLARLVDEVRVASVDPVRRSGRFPRVLDVCFIDSVPHVVEEYLEGRDLRKLVLAEGPLSDRDTLRVAKEVCIGLAALHEAGYVHRDISPDNIFMCADGSIRVLDLGFAKITSQALLKSVHSPTRDSELIGKASYIPNEYLSGQKHFKQATPDWDTYALGLTLHELRTGKLGAERTPPVAGGYGARRMPLGRETPLAGLIATCVDLDPDSRFRSAREMLRAAAEAEQLEAKKARLIAGVEGDHPTREMKGQKLVGSVERLPTPLTPGVLRRVDGELLRYSGLHPSDEVGMGIVVSVCGRRGGLRAERYGRLFRPGEDARKRIVWHWNDAGRLLEPKGMRLAEDEDPWHDDVLCAVCSGKPKAGDLVGMVEPERGRAARMRTH